MITEPELIKWVSQMITAKPVKVSGQQPNFIDRYCRVFQFREDNLYNHLRVIAYWEPNGLGQFWLNGTKIDVLAAEIVGHHNTVTSTLMIDKPSTVMRAAWAPRLTVLLQAYGYDRTLWPRPVWQRS